jgi:hypothetical protein
VTFPLAPLSQQFHHKRLASDTNNVAPALSMHSAIDVPLNSAAAGLRAVNPSCVVSLRAASAIGLFSYVPYDTVLEDTAGGWSPGVHKYICPKDGVYLVSSHLMQSGTASGVYLAVGPLDGTIYPAGFVLSGLTQGVVGEHLAIPSYAVIAKSGDLIGTQINGGAVSVPAYAGTDQTWMSIQYLGKYVGQPAPGTNPSYPLAGDQWIAGETVNDVKLARRFTDKINTLQPFLNDWGAQRSIVLASYNGGAVAAQANIPWTVDLDTSGGMISNGAWVCQQDGLYAVGVSLTQSGAAAALCYADGLMSPYNPPQTAGEQTWMSWVKRYEANGGNTFSVAPWYAFTPSLNYRNWMCIVQLA